MATSFFSAINVIPFSTISVQAEETNQQLTGALYSATQGRSYWPSSNLREWCVENSITRWNNCKGE